MGKRSVSTVSVKDSQILRECPFCGGEASKRLFYKGKYRVHCNVCDAHSGDVCETEAEAIAAWNSRADYHGYEQAAIEAWESVKAWNSRAERTCKQSRLFNLVWSECSSESYEWHGNELPSYCPNCGRRCI